MAKVLPLSGTPGPELIGAGFAKAREMERGAIPFSKKLRVDGGILLFRQDPDGRVTAFVQSAPAFATVFANAQFPETVDSRTSAPGGAVLRIGLFQTAKSLEGTLIFPTPYAPVPVKTRFATSAYSDKYLKLTQRKLRRPLQATGDVPFFPYTIEHDVVSHDGVKEQIRLVNTSSASPASGNYDAKIRFTDFIPSVVSCDRAVLATIDADLDIKATFVYASSAEASPNEFTENRSATGSSHVRLRMLRNTKAAAGGIEKTYTVVDVAPLPHQIDFTQTSVLANGTVFTDRATTLKTVNRIKPAAPELVSSMADPRRSYCLERVSVAPNGEAFVLRETNTELVTTNTRRFTLGPEVSFSQTITVTRGFTLAHVSKAGVVTNTIATGVLGQHGYIDGVFTSADGKRVFVYYGLLNPAYVSPPPQQSDYPTEFLEYLDVIAITRDADGGVAFTKSPPVFVAAISQTFSGVPNSVAQGIRRASVLHGAAVEIAGYLWSDRFCYDTKNKTLLALPDYQQHDILNDVSTQNRDAVTGANADRSTYLSVSDDGRVATYYLLKYGAIHQYQLGVNALGAPAVTLKKSFDAAGTGFSIYEDDLGVTLRFPKPQLFN